MEPFEIMVSESQERMLCVVEPERVGDVIGICEKWETLATPIGQITDAGSFRILKRGLVVGELPVPLLVDDCPLYDLQPQAPDTEIYAAPEPALAGDASPAETLKTLLASANIASRRPVFEQYDPVVQSRTVRRPDESDAAVLQLAVGAGGRDPIIADGSPVPAIAISIDGNGRRVACDPRAGAAEAVYECAANLACVGAEPLGVTNCLNFGNPEKPHVAWQLSEAIEGLAQACEDLGVAVVGGNVSLYNEAPSGPIFPTPVIGMVGKLPDASKAGRLGFAAAGDTIALVGPFEPSLVGSELHKLQGQAPAGDLPPKEGTAIRDALQRVRLAVRSEALHNAHDIAEGGLMVALAECCIAGGIGAELRLPDGLHPFAESFGTGFIVSGDISGFDDAVVLGRVGGDALNVEGLLNIPVSELADLREHGLADAV
jgi:phosphoribosylformylglycinamidine synthase